MSRNNIVIEHFFGNLPESLDPDRFLFPEFARELIFLIALVGAFDLSGAAF
jgi:hypothetical protein